jgi:hypothetical protein
MIQYSSLDDAWGNSYKDISKNNDTKLEIAKEFNISTEKYNTSSTISSNNSFDITPNIATGSNFKESDIYNLSQPDTFIFQNKALDKIPTKASNIKSILPIKQDEQSSINVFSDFSSNRNSMIQSSGDESKQMIESFTNDCKMMNHISQCKYCQNKLKQILQNNDYIKVNINEKCYKINRNILKIIFVFIIILIIILLVNISKDINKTTQTKYNYLSYNPYLARY